MMVLRERIELSASPLPRGCSTTELPQQDRAAIARGGGLEKRRKRVVGAALDPWGFIPMVPRPCLTRASPTKPKRPVPVTRGPQKNRRGLKSPPNRRAKHALPRRCART